MRTKIFITMISLLLSVILITGASAFAGSEKIKARMKDRLPVINALKAEGIIGENNKGYLEFIGGNKAKEDVVNAENEQLSYNRLMKIESSARPSRVVNI